MKFSGRLQIEADPRNWLKTDLNLNHGRVELVSGDDLLGSWSTAHVKAERVEGDRFELQLGDDRAVFAADDALAFSYEALPVLAKKTVLAAATGLRGKLRKGLAGSERPVANEPTSVGISSVGALSSVFTSDHHVEQEVEEEVVEVIEAPQPRKLRDLIQAAVRNGAQEPAPTSEAWWSGEDDPGDDPHHLPELDPLDSDSLPSDPLDSGSLDVGQADQGILESLEDSEESESTWPSEDTTELLSEVSDSPNADWARTDWARTDSASTDSASTDSARTDSARTDSASTDSARTDWARTDWATREADQPFTDEPVADEPGAALTVGETAEDQPDVVPQAPNRQVPSRLANGLSTNKATEPPAYDLSPQFAEPGTSYDKRERPRPSRGLLDHDGTDFEQGDTLGERPAEPFGWIRAAEEAMAPAAELSTSEPSATKSPELDPIAQPTLGDAPAPVLRSLEALIEEVRSGTFSPAQVGALTDLIKAVADAIEDKNRS